MLKFTNGKYKRLGKEKEYVIWGILQGEIQPTIEQEAFMSHVENVWLDHTATDCPESYKQAKAHLFGSNEPITSDYARQMGVRK